MKIILKSIAIILGVSRLNEKYVHAMHLFAALLGLVLGITVSPDCGPAPRHYQYKRAGTFRSIRGLMMRSTLVVRVV